MQSIDQQRKEKPFLNQEIPCTEKKEVESTFSFPCQKKKKTASPIPVVVVGIHCLCVQ